ncbi:YceI family protein [Arenimonas sp.]|uniref:YceI family protein n=1 Tax=Arenimonas sp. TaxID=1872635 RepID=UPI0039E2C30A
MGLRQGLAFCLSLCAGAALATTSARPAMPAQTAWTIDGPASVAQFWTHPRLLPRSGGRFREVQGELRGSAQTGWQVQVRIDTRSLDFKGPGWMERLTRSDAFLAIDRFPEIRFHSGHFADSVLQHGGELHGELSLRGQTRPVVFELKPGNCGPTATECLLQVNGRVNRHNFGMGAYRLTLRDEVDIDLQVRLRPGAPP